MNHNNSTNLYDNEKSKPIEMNLRSLALILSVYFFSKFPSLEVIGFQRSPLLVSSLDDVHHNSMVEICLCHTSDNEL